MRNLNIVFVFANILRTFLYSGPHSTKLVFQNPTCSGWKSLSTSKWKVTKSLFSVICLVGKYETSLLSMLAELPGLWEPPVGSNLESWGRTRDCICEIRFWKKHQQCLKNCCACLSFNAEHSSGWTKSLAQLGWKLLFLWGFLTLSGFDERLQTNGCAIFFGRKTWD